MSNIKHEIYCAGWHIIDQALENWPITGEQLLKEGWHRTEGGYSIDYE